jgi:CDP-glucose 4,6-dehydratase
MDITSSAVDRIGIVHADFWRGRRVFLTGHTGFKGGWLSLWLQRLGARVHGYALAPETQPSLFERARVAEVLAQSTIADVRDTAALASALQQAQPEVVIHMAAQPLVRESYADPVGTYATNVMGTVHLLEAVRCAPSVRAVLVVTTDKCYENREWVWGYRESDALGGFDPYSSSKGCAELVTAAYRQSFFNPARHAEHGVAVASARAGNAIGGGDWSADRLLPDVFRAIQAGQSVEIRNPLATRPWQHVLEPLRGYITLAEKLVEAGPGHAEAFNFGPRSTDAWSVGRVADAVCQRWGGGACWQHDAATHPHEARSLVLDIAKADRMLGWRPVLDIRQALDLTVDWARAVNAGADARDTTLDQIQRYENLMATAHE